MIDHETGYDDTPVCECKPCKDCNGEGTGENFCDFRSPRPCVSCQGHPWTCSECGGSGSNTADCEIHGDEPCKLPYIPSAVRMPTVPERLPISREDVA